MKNNRLSLPGRLGIFNIVYLFLDLTRKCEFLE